MAMDCRLFAGSSFYENEKRKEEMTNQRIQMQNDKLKKLTTDQIAFGISKVRILSFKHQL